MPSPTAWVRQQQQNLNRAHSLAYERMQDAAHHRLAKAVRRKPEVYVEGDKVFMHLPHLPRSFVKKCTLPWFGPYTIAAGGKVGRSYHVQTKSKVRLVHESRLPTLDVVTNDSLD